MKPILSQIYHTLLWSLVGSGLRSSILYTCGRACGWGWFVISIPVWFVISVWFGVSECFITLVVVSQWFIRLSQWFIRLFQGCSLLQSGSIGYLLFQSGSLGCFLTVVRHVGTILHPGVVRQSDMVNWHIIRFDTRVKVSTSQVYGSLFQYGSTSRIMVRYPSYGSHRD